MITCWNDILHVFLNILLKLIVTDFLKCSMGWSSPYSGFQKIKNTIYGCICGLCYISIGQP